MAAEERLPTVGLLCGSGLLPVRVAETVRARGGRVVAVGIKGEADQALGQSVDEIEWTGIAKLGRWIRLFKTAGAEAVLMVGGIGKDTLYKNKAAMMPDLRSLKLFYNRLKSKEDHTILAAVAEEFEREGLHVASVLDYCPELLVPPGPLTRSRPDRRQWEDVCFAWPLAKRIADMQIGQCVVVKDKSVVAVEGIDGTDATLERGGRLAKGAAVAIKLARPGHDVRFDIPCIGPNTVDTMHRSGVDVLAVEARRTIVLDRHELQSRAGRVGVCVIGVLEQDVVDDEHGRP